MLRHIAVLCSALLLIGAFCLHCVLSDVVEVNLTKIPYNYIVEIWVNGSSQTVVVDTGSSALITYDTYKMYSKNDQVCLPLYIDQSMAYFYSSQSVDCTSEMTNVGLGGIFANVSLQSSEYLYVVNAGLHAWNLTNGDMGLSYSFSCTENDCISTPFQTLLANASAVIGSSSLNNSTFGLDFRDENSDIASIASANSTMQLGGVKSEYVNSITWLPQPAIHPAYHNFMIENFQFCGSQLFGNFSTTWPVMVDTGASCLSLPAEIYDAFVARFDNSTEITSLAQLPAFTFQLSTESQSQTFYLPLGAFAVDYDDINKDEGALTFNYQGSSTTTQLCVLRGSKVESNGDYTSPPPTISFGSLALQSLYFASSFDTATEGFANKLSTAEQSYYANYLANPSCVARKICVGEQSYIQTSNECKDPDCDKYFFAHLHEGLHVCVFNPSAVGFGIVFISFIMFMEVVSYMLEQFTGYTLAERNRRSYGGNQNPLGNAFKVDIITLYLSKGVSIVVDAVIRFCQRLSSSGSSGNRRTRLPRDDHGDAGLRAEDMVI